MPMVHGYPGLSFLLLLATHRCIYCQQPLTGSAALIAQEKEHLHGRKLSTVEIVLGMYGPMTSISTTFLATAVAFDLDFRKNFEPDLVTRFGPPIIQIPNLNSSLRIKFQTGNSHSESEYGVGTVLDFVLGQNGYDKVAGFVGGYHSGISMPAASLAAVLEVPQISFGSTSPKLSNKDAYPYFLRTIPPDSIQGAGMWRFLVYLKVPVVGYFHSAEPYGEGLFATVAGLALQAGQGYRVVQLDVVYMKPSAYDISKAVERINVAKSAKLKFFFIGMATDQWNFFHKALDQENMLNSQIYQLVGSEAIRIRPGVKDGMIRFAPVSQGSLFAKFQEMWLKMKASDVIGPSAQARYKIDSWHVKLNSITGTNAAADPTDAMFANMDDYQLEDPFIFDAAYCFAISFNEMLNEGIAAADIKGKALLDKVKACNFPGISGESVAFNSVGDRLAAYNIEAVKTTRRLSSSSASRRLAAQSWVQVATFASDTDSIILHASNTFLWMSGDMGTALPEQMFACSHGNFKNSRGTCVECQEGSWTTSNNATECQLLGELCTTGNSYNTSAAACIPCAIGKVGSRIGCTDCSRGTVAFAEASTKCSGCGPGKYQNLTGQSECGNCTPGSAAAVAGTELCSPCMEGVYSDSGASKCSRCPVGLYAGMTGMSQCKVCPAPFTTPFPGAENISDCACPSAFYRDKHNRDRCNGCPEGMTCAFGSDAADGAAVYPLLNPGYWSSMTEPLSVFACDDAYRCPGGPQGTCGPNMLETSCARCIEGWAYDGETCYECEKVEQTQFLFPTLPMMAVPVLVCCLYRAFGHTYETWGSWRNGLAGLAFIVLNFYQIITMLKNVNIQLPEGIRLNYEFWSFTSDFGTLFKPQCAGFNLNESLIVKTIFPAWYLGLGVATMLMSWLLAKSFPCLKGVYMEVNRTFNAVISMMLTFFLGMVSLSMTLFICKSNPNSTSSLAADRSITCFEDTWQGLLAIGMVAVLLWIVGVATLFIWAIFTSTSKMHDPNVQMRWMFLFIKFRPDRYWWALTFIARGFLLNLGLVILKNGYSQIFWMMIILSFYQLLAIWCMPWRHIVSNLVDISAMMCLILSGACLLWFAKDHVSEADRKDLDTDLIGFSIAFSVILLPCCIWAGLHIMYNSLSPKAQSTKVEDTTTVRKALRCLAAAEDEVLDKFLANLTEWDYFFTLQCASVICFEWFGENSLRPGYTTVSLDETEKQKRKSFHALRSDPGTNRNASQISAEAHEALPALLAAEPTKEVEKVPHPSQVTDGVPIEDDVAVPHDFHPTPRTPVTKPHTTPHTPRDGPWTPRAVQMQG